MNYRGVLVLVMRMLRRRHPTWSRRRLYLEAHGPADAVWGLLLPVRHPVIWARARYIRWHVRRGTWGIRV